MNSSMTLYYNVKSASCAIPQIKTADVNNCEIPSPIFSIYSQILTYQKQYFIPIAPFSGKTILNFDAVSIFSWRINSERLVLDFISSIDKDMMDFK